MRRASRTTRVAGMAIAVAAATAAAGGVSSAAAVPPASPQAAPAAAAPHHPAPSHFTHGRVDNAWFPLKPGNRLVYHGSEDGSPFRDVFYVSYRTKTIEGVLCREVHDRVIKRGHVRERTTDWYAQTKRGVVWYFGERTATLDPRGHVESRDGSFRSGRDGAEAGIFMPAHPRVGESFLQENYPGHAEDRFGILSLNAHAVSPAVASQHAMLTRETTPLEPGVVDHKYYVRDIGNVTEKTVRGGSEVLHLVAITHVPRH